MIKGIGFFFTIGGGVLCIGWIVMFLIEGHSAEFRKALDDSYFVVGQSVAPLIYGITSMSLGILVIIAEAFISDLLGLHGK